MKKVITAILAFVVVALMAFGYWDAMKHREHIGEKPFDPKETDAIAKGKKMLESIQN